MSRRLIAVTTCRARRHQADAQRRTWASGLPDVRFFVGGEGSAEREDEVALPVDDAYDGLPEKVRAVCQWTLENGYDQMLKIDDDVYLVPERLPSYDGYDYVGNVRMHNGEGYPHDYASGFAYLLGERALNLVAHCELSCDKMEDRFVGHLLGNAGGMRVLDEKRFTCCFPFGIDEPKFLWGSPLGKTALALAQYPASEFDGLHYWHNRVFKNV